MKKKIIVGIFIALCLGIIPSLLSCKNNLPVDTVQVPSEKPTPTAASDNAPLARDDLNGSAQFFISHGLIDAEDYVADIFLTRIVAARMVADITGLSNEAENTAFTHPFVDLSERYEQLVGFLYHNNIIEGVTNNHFMENEICDENTFLVFLLRAIDVVSRETSDIDYENVMDIAKERGLLLTEGQNTDMTLYVNEAFDICYNALFMQLGDGNETLISRITDNGVAVLLESENAIDLTDPYQIMWPSIEPFYKETWDDKELDGKRVLNKNGRTYWYGGKARGAKNSITDNGYLELSGKDQDLSINQQYALLKGFMQGNESYGMTFTVNVQSMANEGDEGRVIFRVIPRTADAAFTKYYAVNYFIVQQLGDYQSNLIRCKWSITNTNAPSGTSPLTEAYFLLKENIDYTARLLIENTDDGNVHIVFYIDGADRYTNSVTPLMEYTDSSAYKIMQSAMGPALGISGHLGVKWGYASCVRFDNVALYDTESFTAQTTQLARLADTPVMLGKSDEYANQLRYLINHGVVMPEQRDLSFDEVVSVAQFLATALYLNDQHMTNGQTRDIFISSSYKSIFRHTNIARRTDYDRPINRFEAAMIIQGLLPGEYSTSKYASLFADRLDEEYANAVYYAVQNSYLLLDENNRFNGNESVTRDELLRIFSLAVDSRLRNQNSVLTTSSIFSDNAVLQGGKPIFITGKGMSGDTVTVNLGLMREMVSVVNGVWSVEFPAQPYGGPYVLKISDSGFTYKYRGVCIGEVIVIAGQSNAEMSIYETKQSKDILQKYGYRDIIRVFRPDSAVATQPTFDTTTEWGTVADQYSAYIIGSASAIGVYYVDQLLELNPNLENVKIGIIQITYGGSSIEMFMPECVNQRDEYIQRDNEYIRSGFWNGFMDGITPYSASVLLFYQGENSTQLQYMYEALLKDYIWGVRQAFKDESLPVLLVQISGYGDNYGQDGDSWPYIREVQMRVANTLQHVGLVTTIDLADSNQQEIHSKVKQPIGQRLAFLAMDMVYGQNLGKQSSTMTSYERDGNIYIIHFNALALKLNEAAYGTRDFEVMTAEGKWVDADAKVEGDTLLVWNDDVIVPQGVRYAWSNYPKADLLDQDGLPVLPFNTTKNLNSAATDGAYTTTAQMLKKAYHLLNTGDAVVNLTRDNEIRHVSMINAYVLEYTDGDIPGQAPGDEVALLKKQKNSILAEGGTNETIVSITSHNLKVGDWLFNTKYAAMIPVLEVIDANTVRVERVVGQSSGNLFEVYRNIATVIAQE